MDYMKELNVAITVCDKEGKILQMNDKSQKTNHGDLVGQNVLDFLWRFLLKCRTTSVNRKWNRNFDSFVKLFNG